MAGAVSLDEPRNHKHAAMVENDDHPGWREIAALTEAEDRARHRAELEDRDACESIEAEESRWSGIFRRMTRERPVHHYSDGTSG